MNARSVPSGSGAYRGSNEHPVPKYGGCVTSHCSYWESCPETCMASAQSDFFDFLGLFVQPYSDGVRARSVGPESGLQGYDGVMGGGDG